VLTSHDASGHHRPVDAAEVVFEVAGARFDIQTVPPETDAVASGLKNAHERDGHRIGADAVAGDTAGDVGGRP